MLQPARTKYRKQQKGRNTGVASRGTKVAFGEFGLKATTRGRLTARQLEAARRAISRHIKRGGELQKELEGLLRAQFGLRMQLATQQLTNTSQLKKVRRDIARVRTLMKEKAAK